MTKPDPAFSDAYAWLIKVIELSRDARYKPLMQELISHSPDKKVVRYAEDAIDKLNTNNSRPAYERYPQQAVSPPQSP